MSLRRNEEIAASEVLLIGPDGEVVGKLPTAEAFRRAREKGYDLVEVAPRAVPPVCRMMEPGAGKGSARVAPPPTKVRTLRLRPVLTETDIRLRLWHARAFLEEGGAVELRIEGNRKAASAFAERVLTALSSVGTAKGPSKWEHGELVVHLLPRARKKE